ncbi:hypothetical protein [Longimicrobium sp.]|uniref:hypothetical protein n=1 Tax=Longimicrobium sp. TaxID=2029185 RepID=UPI002E364B64|nr:hypothetical protein [Longimicrobium sp.]HEX6036399.1 hypothetical protein [Longimicrobium sp.]
MTNSAGGIPMLLGLLVRAVLAVAKPSEPKVPYFYTSQYGDYLRGKYNFPYITGSYKYTWSDTRYGFEVCGPAWERVFFGLLGELLQARDFDMRTAELCDDISVLMGYLLGRVYEDLGNSLTAKPDVSHYEYINAHYSHQKVSQTWLSMRDMARGNGSAVSLEIVQRELQEWADANKLPV